MSQEHAAKIQQVRTERKERHKRAEELDKDRKHQPSTNLRFRKHAAYHSAVNHAEACERNAGAIKRAHDKRQNKKKPFFDRALPPGTAVLMTLKENLLTQHAVLASDENTRSSGSIVFRTIKAIMSAKDVERRLERFWNKRGKATSKKSGENLTEPKKENRDQLVTKLVKKMGVRELKQELEKAGADSNGKKGRVGGAPRASPAGR